VRLAEVQDGGGGAAGAVLRPALAALSFAWRGGLALRRSAYALGLRRRRRLPRPVVSVGNLAVGGTGKTPFTAFLAEAIVAKGLRPAILSRGYGPPAKVSGPDGRVRSDEGAVLDHRLGGRVPQVEDPDRARGAATALARDGAIDVFLLDDGFQHWQVARDLDVVLLDATDPFGGGRLLPRGRLREPPAALARAHLVVLTRASLAGPAAVGRAREAIRAHTEAPLATADLVSAAVEVEGGARAPSWLSGRPVFALSGVGNPAAFARTLEALGARVAGRRDLPDHARLAPEDLDAARRAARDVGAAVVVLTRKDAVKLGPLPADVAILDVEVRIVEGGDRLADLLAEVLPAAR
jgi:tetraacyldisaccharide 4'-kinase